MYSPNDKGDRGGGGGGEGGGGEGGGGDKGWPQMTHYQILFAGIPFDAVNEGLVFPAFPFLYLDNSVTVIYPSWILDFP